MDVSDVSTSVSQDAMESSPGYLNSSDLSQLWRSDCTREPLREM